MDYQTELKGKNIYLRLEPVYFSRKNKKTFYLDTFLSGAILLLFLLFYLIIY